MGVAQNSINQAIGVGLGLAGTGAHLANQQASIKEAEETKKLAGLNAANVVQGKLDTNLEEMEKQTEEVTGGINKAAGAYRDYFGQVADANEKGVDVSGEGNLGRDSSGKYYSLKQLRAAEVAAKNVTAETMAQMEKLSRIQRTREMLVEQGNTINKIYGTNVVTDKMNPKIREKALEAQKNFHDIRMEFSFKEK